MGDTPFAGGIAAFGRDITYIGDESARLNARQDEELDCRVARKRCWLLQKRLLQSLVQ